MPHRASAAQRLQRAARHLGGRQLQRPGVSERDFDLPSSSDITCTDQQVASWEGGD